MEGKGERETSPNLISQTEPLNNSHYHILMQQLEAQKMMDLKKAYADVILNTAKEAATRAMASEQRALQFQHELAAAKDEALCMLLRLKQMIDAKTAEAEMASLNQQRKIQELEAQLNEAEDVITDLRAELKQVWFELEKTKNSQIQSLYGQNIKQVTPFESAKPETLVSSRNQELECVTNGDVKMKNKSLTANVLDDKHCNSTKQTEHLCISNLEDHNAHNFDFASIIMSSKELELCKNGCTQRIRALEGKLLDKKLHSGDVNNQHFGIKNGPTVKDSDGQVAKFRAPSPRTEKMENKKPVKCHKKPKQKKTLSYCRSCFLSSCKIHINENCKSKKGAIRKWKRRHRHVRTETSVLERGKPSFVLKQCSSVCDNGKYSEYECVAKKNPMPPLTDVEHMHESTGVAESVQAVNKSELVEKAIEKDNELLTFEGSTSQNITGPSSDMKVEVVDIPSTKTDLEDAKAFEENYGSSGQEDSRFLKYTFQRKRKRESMRNLDEKIGSERRGWRRNKMMDWNPKNLA